MGNQKTKTKIPTEVLIVDDDLNDLELMCNTLRVASYKVLPASGYRSGINTFSMHSGDIRLLVTAVALPEQNGCELAKKLIAVKPELQVLFVSAPSGAETCRFYGMLGPGLHFLEKPLDPDGFVRMVRLILEQTVPFRTMGAG